MDDLHETAACAILIGCALKIKNQRKRTVWCKDWLQRRDDSGLYTRLVNELKLADRGDYRRFMRMNTSTFEV